MTATDELRRLLDERGVEYRVSATGYSIDIGPNMTAYANRTDTTLDVSLRGFTPEQAIAATLGRGTCKVVSSTLHEYEGGYAGSEWEHELSCGHTVWWSSGDSPEWCPWCGKKVVDE